MHIVHLFVGIGQFHLKPAYEIVKIPVEELVLIKTPKSEEIIEKIKSRASDGSIEATMTTSIAVGEMKQETATQLGMLQCYQGQKLCQETTKFHSIRRYTFSM